MTGWGLPWGVEETVAVILLGGGIQCVDFGSQCSLCGFSFSSQLQVTYYTVTTHDQAFLRRGQGAERNVKATKYLLSLSPGASKELMLPMSLVLLMRAE